MSNIELARATKADGFSMKVIAVMTMAFLPGTYIATLFSLPLIQWDASEVVSRPFWLYWAISIPITVVIFLVWWGFDKWGVEVVQKPKGKGPVGSASEAMEMTFRWAEERDYYVRRGDASGVEHALCR